MKKVCLILLCCILLLSGCKKQDEKILAPVHFYYLCTNITYGTSDSVITSEARESQGHEQDYTHLLSVYLEGPKSPELYDLFPVGTRLHKLEFSKKTAIITLTDEFANAQGLDLTLNSACIAKTCISLTGCKKVELRCETAPLGDSGVIIMDESTLLLLDEAGFLPAR